MVKQLNKGFTLLETLVALSIILLFITLTISYNAKIKDNLDQKQIVKTLEIDYFNTKKLAMINDAKYQIIFDYNQYSIIEDDLPIKTVEYPDIIYSNTYWVLTFNNRGNINQAKSIIIGDYRVVFNLGSGGFYYEKQ